MRKTNENLQMKNFNEEWINLLTGGKLEKQLEFEQILANSKCEVLAIMKMRRLQMQKRKAPTLLQLKLGNLDEKYLQKVLQELFLEPISIENICLFYELTSKKYDNMMDALEELYLRAKKDRGLRFLSIALTI